MRYFLFLAFGLFLNLSYAQASSSYDSSVFQTKMPAELKEKMRQSEFYKTLVSLGSQKTDSIRSNPIHPLHGRLHEEVFSQNKLDLPKFFQTLIYLEDITQAPYVDKNFNSYFFDLQATALIKMAEISKFAKTKTEEDRLYKEKEYKRLMKAALIRVAQWKILAEEDTRKCEHKEEALAFFKANAAKYAFREDAFTVISRGELNKIALQTSSEFKDRPANMHLCEMSKNYRDRLKKTGTAVYATEQDDGQVLIHTETPETPVKENSKKLDLYINTGQIEPEYISVKDWEAIRQRIRADFSKIDLNKPIIQ